MYILNEIYSYYFRSEGVVILITETNEYVNWYPTLTDAINALGI